MGMTHISGLPGSGKTLYMLQWIEEVLRKPVIEGGPRRPVFYRGIKGLTLDWTEWEPERWEELPPGSIFVIDECQDVFPPRGRGDPPDWIRELAKHRHGGVDLVLLTQHPMLFDTFVRRLCDRHFHVMRVFGMQRSTVHEFASGVRENVDKSRTGSIRHEWSYPKKYFGAYQSAELHTGKTRLPMRVYVMLAAPVVFALLAWAAYSRLMPDTAAAASAKGGAAAASAPRADTATRAQARNGGAERDMIREHTPRVAGLDYTAPIYDEVTKPVVAPYPAACVQAAERCHCYSQQGTRLDVPADMCASIVARGFFVAWNQPHEVQGARPVAVLPPEPPPASFGIGSTPRVVDSSSASATESAQPAPRRRAAGA